MFLSGPIPLPQQPIGLWEGDDNFVQRENRESQQVVIVQMTFYANSI